MINRTFSSVAVVIALGILTPIQANAFGLGKLELSSALNEPFKAIIPVTALREDEEGNLQVRLATSDEFARAGIERSHYLTNLVFNVVEHSGGATIEVTSQQPIKEPFVDFLLTATTGEGRLIREYTVLLDPPKSVFSKPAKVVTPPQAKTTSQPSSNKTTYQYPDSGYQAPASNYYSGNSYGPTKRDDTLWDIALATKPSSASVHQMMLALLDANPTAFIRNNINNLKTGYTLTVPSLDEITKLSNRQAVARVAEQYQQWKDANNVVVAAQVQAESNIAGSNDPLSESEGQVDVSSDARLQLVVDSDDATMGSDELSPLGSDALTKLRDQLTLAQETIEGQEQENIDFKSRMDAMEEQLEIMRRIIMVKDADLARLQGALGDEEQVELESDNLSEEMQQALAETEIDDSPVDELVDGTEELIEDTDAGMEALADSAEEMFDEGVDELVDNTEEFLENTGASIQDPAERMLDGAAVAAAAEAAREEAEYSGNYVFIGADPVSAVLPEQIDFNAVTPTRQDPLQAERMLDEEAVAASVAAAREEAELRGDYLFLGADIDSEAVDIAPAMEEMDDAFDEMSDTLDEAEEVLPYPEVNTVEELAVEGERRLSLVDKVKAFIAENKTALLGGLGALFLGLLAWLFARRRNQAEEYEWVDTETIDGADDSEVEPSTIATNVADENEELVADESSEVLIDSVEDIDDLLKQAEMSIAYGEYDDAHAIVERARLQEPDSKAVALKLVALAFHQKQPEEFNKLIADIDIDKESAEWQEILAWGKELAPENELLEQEDVTAAGADLKDDLADSLDADVLQPETIDINEESDSILEFDIEESLEEAVQDKAEGAALSFDTDFDLESASSSNDTDLDLDAPLSFDIEIDDSPELSSDSDSLEDVTELVLDASDDVLELSTETDELVEINLDEIATDTIEEDIPDLTPETILEEAEELDIGADDLEFDIGDFDEVDEAETKLDLAAAYVDMGDPDGAKNILNEVLQEGNDEQKSRAQDLLNNLK